MQKILLEIKLTLFFLSNPVSFNRQDYEKQKGPRTSNQLPLFTPQQIPLLVMYYLTHFDGLL